MFTSRKIKDPSKMNKCFKNNKTWNTELTLIILQYEGKILAYLKCALKRRQLHTMMYLKETEINRSMSISIIARIVLAY